MADSPAHLVKFNLSVPLVREKLFAGLEFQYTSQRESLHNTPDAANQPLTVQGEKVGDFGIVNFTLFSQNLIKNLEMSASVYNLFDSKYGDPASRFHQQDIIERDGRSFRFKLTYRF
jgi:iron complex outermembrane receptor protein